MSGLRARHFKTSASIFFFNKKKFPLFFTYKRVCKTLPNVTTLYHKTCVTDIKVAECNTPSDGDGALGLPSLDISQIRQFKNGL